MASNLKEDAKDASGKPSDETTEEEKTSAEKSEKQTHPEGEVDYKEKFSESSKEAQRLLEENRKMKEELGQSQDVMDTLFENPELLSQVQKAYSKKVNPTQSTESTDDSQISEKVVEKKVRDVVTPLTKELEDERRQRVQEAVGDFNEKHPDAAEGTETWKQVIEWLPAMRAKGLPLKQGLEKAYEIVTVDKAKRSGKTEAIKELFEKQQAAAGGGSSGSAVKNRPEEVELTSQEKKVAENLGVSPEKYQKNKRKP